MHKIFFDLFVNPRHTGVHKEKILNQLFETCMVPACPGWGSSSQALRKKTNLLYLKGNSDVSE
jgi:hypothetical protein